MWMKSVSFFGDDACVGRAVAVDVTVRVMRCGRTALRPPGLCGLFGKNGNKGFFVAVGSSGRSSSRLATPTTLSKLCAGSSTGETGSAGKSVGRDRGNADSCVEIGRKVGKLRIPVGTENWGLISGCAGASNAVGNPGRLGIVGVESSVRASSPPIRSWSRSTGR